MNLTIIGFLNFLHRPEIRILENTTFRKRDLFPSWGDGRKKPTVLSPFRRAILNPVTGLWAVSRGLRV
jgi:hypothetical protein